MNRCEAQTPATTDFGLSRAAPTPTAVQDAVGRGTAGDYFQLLKPRVMSLVVLTALVGMVVAPGQGPHDSLLLAIIALLCIAVGAGASGALNMWYDADIDSVMQRTAQRPIPGGKIVASEALAFGLVLSGVSVLTLGLATNWFAAALLAGTILFYVVIYTMWLKRWTAQNIVIGGAAGALPPVIGWAAGTGSIGLESLVLFAIIFLWTPPHFWALSLLKTDDYRRAGVPMLPVVSGEAVTRRQILLYTLLLAPATLAPWIMGFAGPVYGVTALVASVVFIRHAARLARVEALPEMRPAAVKVFTFSIAYLFVLFAVLLAEHVLGLERISMSEHLGVWL